jgi:hypothetical protein
MKSSEKNTMPPLFFVIAKKVSYQARMGLNVLTLDEIQ